MYAVNSPKNRLSAGLCLQRFPRPLAGSWWKGGERRDGREGAGEEGKEAGGKGRERDIPSE